MTSTYKALITIGLIIAMITALDWVTTLYNKPPPPTQSEELKAVKLELEICLGYSAGYQAGYGTFCKQVGCALGPEPTGENP